MTVFYQKSIFPQAETILPHIYGSDLMFFSSFLLCIVKIVGQSGLYLVDCAVEGRTSVDAHIPSETKITYKSATKYEKVSLRSCLPADSVHGYDFL